MATSTKNVIVGAAALFTSIGNSSNNSGRPTTYKSDLSNLLPTSTSARAGLLASSNYREVGFTNTGLEISYEPVYGEVMVDQLLDAARLFKQTLKVLLKTELTEATLENLQFSWGQMDSVYVADETNAVVAKPTIVNNDTAYNSNADTPAASLAIAAGALGDAPVERVLIAVGQAPTVKDDGSDTYSERVYYARRVLSVQQSQFTLARNTPTTFPVTFRLLPDANYDGAEYGKIIDRVLA